MGKNKTSHTNAKYAVKVLLAVAMTAPLFAHADDEESAGQYFRRDQEITAKYRQGLFQMSGQTPSQIPVARPKAVSDDNVYRGSTPKSSYAQKAKARREKALAPRAESSDEITLTSKSKLPPKQAAMDTLQDEAPVVNAKVAPKSVRNDSSVSEIADKKTVSAPTAEKPLLQSSMKPQAASLPQNCEAPTSRLQETMNISKQIKETAQKNAAGPIVAQTQTVMIDDELNDYDNGFEKAQRKAAKKPNRTMAHPEQVPTNSFVLNLLQFAKIEASKDCRTLGSGTKCRPGRPKGACLQGVRMAFQRANSESTARGWTEKAKNAGPFLKKYGYHKVVVSDPKAAPVGSVFIYADPNNAGRAGHIEIKGTDGYYSDFYSKYMINDHRGLGLNRKLNEVWVPN